MQLNKKILFPVDLSDVSVKIAPSVRDKAVKLEAEVHLIYVVPILGYCISTYLLHPYLRNFEAEIENEAVKKLQDFMEASWKDDPCEARIVFGDPTEEIVNYAEWEEIDLIIMGTNGRNRIERRMLGSVTERVESESSVPVLVVDLEDNQENHASSFVSSPTKASAIAS